MAGNPDNARIWGNADVYVGALTSPNPATVDAPFDNTWGLVGLLDGDEGFTEARNWDSDDFFAWGNLLIRTSRRNFALTRQFTALETNAVTLGLVWPGSAPGTRAVPKGNNPIKLAFQTVDGNRVVRAITRRYAEVETVDDIKDSESDLKKYAITVKIYPDASGVLFDMQPIEGQGALQSVVTAPATKNVAVGAYQPLTATATYADNSTVDVTSAAVWTTSDATKATVDRGYVKGVATGAANVKATFGGMSAQTAVTVA